MKICLLPSPSLNGVGGVHVALSGLAKALVGLRHEIVPTPQWADVVHGHAFDGSDNVYTSHGVYPEPSNLNEQLYNNIARADVVTAVSRWTAEQFSHLGVTPRIINNGIEVDLLKGLRETGEGYVIWAKAGITQVSNADRFTDLVKSRSDAKFVSTFYSEKVVPHNLKVIGLQSREKILDFIAGASVYVSTGTENFPIQVLEAMALGVPVLALPLGGTQEIDGIHLTDNLKDGLEYCLSHREEIVKAQDSALERYDWSNVARQYVSIYEESRRVQHNGKVSVIIPLYNYASRVSGAIESCLKQTEKPDEIIVVDDGSTDDTTKVEQKYKGKIKFIRQKNAGVSQARNNGIRNSSGEFVVCLDADDQLSPNFTKAAKKVISENRGIGIAYPGMTVVGTAGKAFNDFEGSPFVRERLKTGNFIPCANMFRRVAWQRSGGYKEIHPSWEDYELWLNMVEYGFRAKAVPKERLLYLAHDQGRTGQSDRENCANLLRATVDGYHPRLYGNSGLVSFVIPCYNQWQYIEDALKSVFDQTYPHVECIVVDDASTEPVRYDVLSKYPKVRFVQRSKNGGLSAARNTGISLASGGYIVPLDADDKVSPDFVSECLKRVYNTERYAYTDIQIWHNQGNGPAIPYEIPEWDAKILLRKHIHACTILIKKDWIVQAGGYDEGMRDGYEDYEIVLRLIKRGHCGIKVPKDLFFYRWTPDSMRQRAQPKQKEIMKYIFGKHKDIDTGEFDMGSCCGGGPKSKAIRAVYPEEKDITNLKVPEGYSAVFYLGTKTGDMTKLGGSHRVYRYSAFNRIVMVHNSDLALFTNHPMFTLLSEAVIARAKLQPSKPQSKANPLAILPEGNDDFSNIVSNMMEEALKNVGINTFQRLVAAPEEIITKVIPDVSKRREIRGKALEHIRQAVGA